MDCGRTNYFGWVAVRFGWRDAWSLECGNVWDRFKSNWSIWLKSSSTGFDKSVRRTSLDFENWIRTDRGWDNCLQSEKRGKQEFHCWWPRSDRWWWRDSILGIEVRVRVDVGWGMAKSGPAPGFLYLNFLKRLREYCRFSASRHAIRFLRIYILKAKDSHHRSQGLTIGYRAITGDSH